MMTQAPVAPYQSASLYVGDLNKDLAESSLFDLFNRVGPVISIRVCRDSITRKSLGYAYVNFQDVKDAERALDTMNFTEINGKPCRIMWSQRDPSLRKTGMGNVYVSNLAPSVDNKALYDTFSVFGNILSCKVVTDDTGASKGYGYVHFETGEAAADAIAKLDGANIEDVEVHVSHFVKRQDRAAQANWTNLYVKQFPTTWDDAKLRELFGAFGTIANVFITRDETGKSKGFGFVNMADHESAAKAVEALHNKTFEEGETPFTLYVGKAQKKAERARELKAKREQLNAERVTKYQGMNLYVKNISDTVSDEAFREAFAPFGNITSAKIMRDDAKISRGFGFVCYSTPEEATKAVNDMNGKPLGGKPLVVTFYQRKDIRRVQLAANYAPNARFPQGMAGGVPVPFMGMYMAPGQQGFQGQAPRGQVPYPYPPNAMGARGAPANPRGNAQFGAPRPSGNYYAMSQFGMGGQQQMNFNKQPRPQGNFAGAAQGGVMPGAFPAGQQGQQRRPAGPGMQQPPMMGNGPARGPMVGGPMPGRPMPGYPMMPHQQQQVRNIKFSNQTRNQAAPMMAQGMMPANAQPQMMPSSKMDFSEALLAVADPMMQKNMIGEKLYPLIYSHAPEQAGKITGMLLEMDNGELINLIESPDALSLKVDEALTVLRNHKATAEA